MGTGYKNRGSGAAGLGFKNRGAKLVEGAAYTNRGATDGVNEAFKNRGQAWGSDAYYNRGPNDFASLSVLGLAEFYAPLTHSLILTRGTGDPTYSRATNAWEFDNEGKLITVPSGSARFGGARMVRNLQAASETCAANTQTRTNLTADATTSPIGTSTADLIYEDTNTGTHYSTYPAVTIISGAIYTRTLYCKAAGRSWVRLQDYTSGAHYCSFDLANGTTGTPSGCTASITSVGDGWYRCSITFAAGSTTTALSFLCCTSAVTTSYEGDGASGAYVWGCQLENVTGQADQTASEYVSAGVLSAPYHGAGVDGVKWFATNKDGSAISASSLLGYHAEGARTNSLLYSRDLTNAAWVKTNITAAKTATGIDNAANSASTLTASAADATILQTLSMAAAARSFSAYVKRRTGTGSVYITRDGGTNWTDITSSLGASWTRVKIENTSVLNPSVGFKIATSGDAIDVDVCQDEAGSFISSPIITTTASVTRNADALYYAAANIRDTQGSILFTQKLETLGNTGSVAVLATELAGNVSPVYKGNAGTLLSSADSSPRVGTLPWTTSIQTEKAAISWTTSPSRRCLTLNSTTQEIIDSYDGSWNATALYVGYAGVGVAVLYGYAKNVYTWSTALTDAQLQQVTA